MKALYTWVVKGLLMVVPFLSLWIALPFFFPYITGRNFLFRIIVELVFALWLGLILFYKEYRPKTTPLVWAIFIFLAIVGLADAFGIDPYHSFWSRFERMEGYLMFLHLVPYFLILTTMFKKKDWATLFNFFVITGTLVSGYAVLQKLGIKPAIQGGLRIDGTIGNPTYLAAYLSLVLVLTALLFYWSKRVWQKYLYGAAAAFFLLMIYYSASRGAVFGLLAGVITFTAMYLLFVKPQTGREQLFRKIIIGGTAGLLVLVFGVWLLRNTSFVQNSFALQRLTSLSLQSKTLQARSLLWRMTLKGVAERPILGWGQESYLTVFAKHYDPRMYDQEPWFDRSHNIVLDWLINAGVLGLIAYLSMFGAMFYLLRRAVRQKFISALEAIIIVSGITAYFVANLFVFDNFNTYVIFFALLAYVNKFFQHNDALPEPALSEKQLIAVVLALTAVIPLVYFVNVRPMAQAKGILDALKATAVPGDTINNTRKQFNYTLGLAGIGETETLEQYLRTATMLATQNVDQNQKGAFLIESSQAAERYMARFPNDIRMHLFLANLYNRMALLNGSYLVKAREHIDVTIKLSPKRQDLYFLLADNAFLGNDTQTGFDALQKAIAFNKDNANAYGVLGRMGALVGRDDIVELAIKELERIVITTPDPEKTGAFILLFGDNMEKIGVTYLRLQKWDLARVIYEKMTQRNPRSAPFFAQLADVYVQLKQLDKAAVAAQRAAEIDPDEYKSGYESILQLQKK